MPDNAGFYTLKGYALSENNGITAAMEDYLEMICRLQAENEVVRINRLAEMLHVKPSSASKMAGNLMERGLVAFEKYGYITLTADGEKLGRYLIFRHDVLHRFLCYINGTADELEQVEKIEHFINTETVWNIDRFMAGLADDEKVE